MNFTGNKITESFESRLYANFCRAGFDEKFLRGKKIGAGVSGGADSMALLLGLCRLSLKIGFEVYVLTVNHNVREASVSLEDSVFVSEACLWLKNEGCAVFCSRFDIPEGAVFSLCENKKCGTEEAARILRYKAFDDFIESNSLDLFCIAHNRNDQLETVLMRFISGSGAGGIGGIKISRDRFFRPMLDISRNLIEEYAGQFEIEWRTDCTNLDQHYLRNRIRHGLVPVLNEHFSGWDKAVLRSAEKARLDEDFFTELSSSFVWKAASGKSEYKGSLQEFTAFHRAVQFRIIQRGFNLCGFEGRLSYGFLEEFFRILDSGNREFSLEYEGYILKVSDGSILIKINELVATESSFFVIIEENGEFELPFGTVSAVCENNRAKAVVSGSCGSVEIENISVPFCVRSRRSDDFIETNDGGMRSLSDVFSDWHVCVENKQKIPVFQELTGSGQKIVCACGSVLGYKDWILRGY